MKAKEFLWCIATVIFLILSGCKSYYIAGDFESRTAGHQTFAILPFEMVFSGNAPEKLTEEDIKKIGEVESKVFMISFYNEVPRSTRAGRKPMRVNVQHYDKTLSILESVQMDIRSGWKEDPAKLAELLGVDAVVKGRIEKHRFMSDLASYGIDLGIHILSALSESSLWPWLPSEVTMAKEIQTSYSLIDSQGMVLWSIAYDIDADWQRPANEIIEEINRKSVRNFPYRVR